jgi:catechol 2,3-dioxygenase-like lactoylglutathione lyase family enzyme
MRGRLTVVTLGVGDLKRSTAFYAGLGFSISSESQDAVTFIDAGGVVLSLFGRVALAEDAHVPAEGSGFGGITLAWNVGSTAEVDTVIAAAVEGGARLLKQPGETFWGGYSGYFADPDGYPWEVAHNPFWPLDADGTVTLPA